MARERKYIRWWPLMLIVWFLLAFSIFFQISTQTPLTIEQCLQYVLLVIGVSIVGTHFLSDVLLPVFITRNQLWLFVVLALIVSILMALIYAWIDMQFNPDGKPFVMKWVSMLISAMLLTGNICGIRFYRQHAAIEKEHRQLQTAHLEAELKLLRDQVNPHFLFNVINSIHVLMHKDVKQASSILLKFSDMLRHHLYDSTKPYILLKEEIAYLQNYVNVEMIRWGSDVKAICHWIDAPEYYRIGPFMLSPFVENAFKYVSHDAQNGNYVKIDMQLEGKLLRFTVENSFDAENRYGRLHQAGGLGLENVKKRLSLMYPGRHHLEISADNNVFLITLSIQITEV